MEVSGQLRAPAALPQGKESAVPTGKEAVEKRKILHCRESNPGRLARSPSLYRLSYPEIWRQEMVKIHKSVDPNETRVKSSVFWNITLSVESQPTFWRNMSPPELATCFILVSCFDFEDGSEMFLRNVGWISTDYTALYPRKYNSS
jgi:hypothetical protein